MEGLHADGHDVEGMYDSVCIAGAFTWPADQPTWTDMDIQARWNVVLVCVRTY